MNRKVMWVLLSSVCILLIGTSVWGYFENREKRSLLIKIENQYQRAFHELNDHLDQLCDEMGETLALNSRRQLSTSLTNVWRLAYAAQGDLGQLPLVMVPFDDAQKFVYTIGKFSYEVAIRDLDRKPLTDREYTLLENLYTQSKQIKNSLESLQGKVLNKDLRWVDVELALAAEDQELSHPIIDGFKKVDKLVSQYPEVDLGPTVNNSEVMKREKIKRLKGKKITSAEATQIVAKVVGKPVTAMKSVLNKKGDYQTYSISYQNNGRDVFFDVTLIGGHIVWMDSDRRVVRKKISFDQAEKGSTQFLEHINYKNMVPISYSDTGNVAIYTFVHKEKGVYVYPETVAVKVAQDNGEVIGFQADDYVFNDLTPSDLTPDLTLSEVKTQVSPRLRIQKTNLAIIYNDAGKEVLCYEFLGTLSKGDQYRLFLNADTGEEEFIQKIKKADPDNI